MRLFTALLFDDELLDWLADVQQSLWRHGVMGQYTAREHMHLTLVFIGETSWLGSAQAALESVTAPRLTLRTAPLGRFARWKGDILWLGLEPHPLLRDIHMQLTTALRKAGFTLERQSYTPHITLARGARLPPGLSLADISPPARCFTSDGISLMLSSSERGELVHTELGWHGLQASEEGGAT